MKNFIIPEGELDDWLNDLKPYQSSALKKMIDKLGPDEAAKNWITSTGSENITPFGGIKDKKPFWEKFKKEFDLFICDDDSYKDEKKDLKAESKITRTYLIGIISGAIGATLGYAATLLAPAVAILLCSVSKMTRNAYCSNKQLTE